MNRKFYSFEKINDTSANVYIYGDIVSYEWDESDVSSFGFKKELEELGEVSELNVHINSCGGSTFEGLTIYNLLKQYNAKVNTYIDGIAASAASIIAMAGQKIYIPKTALMMIHNCWTWATGNAKELRKTADDMDKIAEAYKQAYLSKINIKEDKLEELLENETYLTAQECVEMGFADEIIENQEETAVNQHMNRFIINLVNQLKQQEQAKEKLEEIKIEQIVEKTTGKLLKDFEEAKQKELEKKKSKTNENQDTLIVSFFNNFLK